MQATTKPIVKGSTVKYQGKFYKVTAIFARLGTANLGQIFGSHIYHKGAPIADMVEAHDEWYGHWRQSETYQCM